MNVQDITFGVEIETTIPAAGLVVGPHGMGAEIPAMPGWKADRDPSIHASRGRQACEFVSPVLKGADGLRQLIAAIRAIKAMGGKVNASCGLHIHVGFDKSDVAASEKLATLVSNFETAIYASTGTKNRERGRWCRGLGRYGTAAAALQASRSYRYHVANFATDKPTVEFRAFSASLNEGKIVGYVRMCVAMVEKALRAKRATNWTAPAVTPTSPIARGGAGATAMNRLFYYTGWTRGRESHVHGDLSGEGLPSIARSKKVLMEMAKKYDADAG